MSRLCVRANAWIVVACLGTQADSQQVDAEKPAGPQVEYVRLSSASLESQGDSTFMGETSEQPLAPSAAIDAVNKDRRNYPDNEPLTVQLLVKSVHPPFVVDREKTPGHNSDELHLDFQSEPADFAKDQLTIVLTKGVVSQLNRIGIKDLRAHFLDRKITVSGKIASSMYTARKMKGTHHHLIVQDGDQIQQVD